jgi:hypothetical protein
MPAKKIKAAKPVAAGTDNEPTDESTESAYTPVGEVEILAEADRDGHLVQVLTDGVRTWKEVT